MLKKYFTYFCGVTLLLIVLAAATDYIFFLLGGSKLTLSYEFWESAKHYPFVPFVLGFLCGHLVWQYNPDTIKPS